MSIESGAGGVRPARPCEPSGVRGGHQTKRPQRGAEKVSGTVAWLLGPSLGTKRHLQAEAPRHLIRPRRLPERAATPDRLAGGRASSCTPSAQAPGGWSVLALWPVPVTLVAGPVVTTSGVGESAWRRPDRERSCRVWVGSFARSGRSSTIRRSESWPGTAAPRQGAGPSDRTRGMAGRAHRDLGVRPASPSSFASPG